MADKSGFFTPPSGRVSPGVRLGDTSDTLQTIADKANAAASGLEGVSDAVGELKEELGQTNGALDSASQTLVALDAQMQRTSEAVDAVKGGLTSLGGEVSALASRSDNISENVNSLKEQGASLDAGLRATGAALGRLEQSVAALGARGLGPMQWVPVNAGAAWQALDLPDNARGIRFYLKPGDSMAFTVQEAGLNPQADVAFYCAMGEGVYNWDETLSDMSVYVRNVSGSPAWRAY